MLETIAVIVSLGWIVFGIRWLGTGSDAALGGLFQTSGPPDWAPAVQEEDAPRFVFGRAS